jgi:hypothetical protein
VARLRTRVERAAVLHRQAAAAISATATAVDGYSPSSAPAEQYAEQHDLAARLRAAAADLVPGWLGTGLDAVSAATPAGDTAVPAYLRIGLAHPLDDARFPAIAPLLGSGHLAIDADARDPRVAGLLRSVLLRLVAAAAPGSLLIPGDRRRWRRRHDRRIRRAAQPRPPATDHPGMQGVLIEADHWIRSGGAGQPASHYVLVIASLPELTDGNDLARIAQLARPASRTGCTSSSPAGHRRLSPPRRPRRRCHTARRCRCGTLTSGSVTRRARPTPATGSARHD